MLEFLLASRGIMMKSLHRYFKPGAGVVKWRDEQLPDPNGPLSSIVAAEAIRDANDAHMQLSRAKSSQQLQGGESKRYIDHEVFM